MPWRGAEYAGELPTLGYMACDWIEQHLVIPDGDRMGAPYLLTEEMQRFLIRYYRLRENGGLTHYGACLVRPQKWGK